MFAQSKAIALYFYDMTDIFEQNKLQKAMLESKARHNTFVNYQMTVNDEFMSPLSTSQMFLESLVSLELSQEALRMVKMITQQINILQFFVCGLEDFILIE